MKTVRLSLIRGKPFSWCVASHETARVRAKGYAFLDDRFVRDEDLAFLLARVVHEQRQPGLVRTLRALNGQFAVVASAGGETWAAVDHVRSMPLFVCDNGNEVVITDSAEGLSSEGLLHGCDATACSEFLKAGYTVGPRTLAQNLRQIEAGGFFCSANGNLEFYYQHLHGDYLEKPDSEHFGDLELLSERVFRRLVDSVAGRPIAVPLSSGYDSRYIAVMLRRLGVQNVVCYTFGGATSFEIGTSQQVARRLGFDWHYVEYDRTRWRQFFESAASRDYLGFAAQHSSVPVLLEFLAVQELRGQGVIADESVVVPGFCGDLLGGSYVPAEIEEGKVDLLLRRGLGAYLYSKNFCFENQLSPTATVRVLDDIQAHLGQFPVADSLEQFVSVNEAWFTCHKVAKFVVNALRIYDFFGVEWRMPLWDKELIQYWYRIPYTQRLSDCLYDRFLFDRLFREHDVCIRKKPPRAESRYAMAVKSLMPASMLEHAKRWYRGTRRRFMPNDPNRFLDVYDHYFDDLVRRGHRPERSTDLHQVLASWYLAETFGNSRLISV